MNGNPADHAFRCMALAEPGGAARHAPVARDGRGEYRFDGTIGRVGFVSGAFALARNLVAALAAGDGDTYRADTGRRFTSHAWIREHVLLMRVVRDVDPAAGFHVDVGTYDPDVDTITRAFLRYRMVRHRYRTVRRASCHAGTAAAARREPVRGGIDAGRTV